MLYEIRRIRIANKIPISYHHSFIPVNISEGLEKYDLQNEQLCDIMSTYYGLRRTYSVETLESYLADDQKAEILGIGYGFPLTLLQDIIFDAARVAFEYSRIYFRGDKVTLRFEHGETS
jgi:GntR family transcriptional regulator